MARSSGGVLVAGSSTAGTTAGSSIGRLTAGSVLASSTGVLYVTREAASPRVAAPHVAALPPRRAAAVDLLAGRHLFHGARQLHVVTHPKIG
jgi:hypothetical protein